MEEKHILSTGRAPGFCRTLPVQEQDNAMPHAPRGPRDRVQPHGGRRTKPSERNRQIATDRSRTNRKVRCEQGCRGYGRRRCRNHGVPIRNPIIRPQGMHPIVFTSSGLMTEIRDKDDVTREPWQVRRNSEFSLQAGRIVREPSVFLSSERVLYRR